MSWFVCEKNKYRIHEKICLRRQQKKMCPSWCSERIEVPTDMPKESTKIVKKTPYRDMDCIKKIDSREDLEE